MNITHNLFSVVAFIILANMTLGRFPFSLHSSLQSLVIELIVAVISTVLFLLYCRWKWGSWRQYFIPYALIVIALTGLIFHYFTIHQLLWQAESISQLPKKLNTQIRIEEVLHQGDYKTLVASAKLQADMPAYRLFINWKAETQPQIGEIWQAQLQLRPLSARLNKGGFDRQQWFFSKKITAQTNVKQASLLQSAPSSLLFNRYQRLQQAVNQTSALSNQGLLIALGFGERAWLDNNTWRIYQQTNTAHLIAISGLHIGLAWAIGFLLARSLQLLLPTRYISPAFPLLCGLFFALFYAYLAGFSVPTLRAMVALCWLFLIRWIRCYYSSFQLFTLVVASLLLSDPLMLLSSSFWLSVGAVGCLILWYQFFPLRLIEWRNQSLTQAFPSFMGRLLGGGLALFHLQLGLLLLFTPIQLFLFNGTSSHGLLANLIAVPFYSLLLVPVVLFTVLTNGSLKTWWLADWLAGKITQIIALFDANWLVFSINQSLVITATLSVICGLGLYGLYSKQHQVNEGAKRKVFQYSKWGFNLSPKRKIQLKWYRNGLLGCGLLASFCLLWLAFRLVSQSSWRLETLDVGQGLATLIVKNGKGILYDTGASWQGGSMAQLEILPYLQREGIKLEMLILSHDDNDHSGGVPFILQQFPQAILVSSSQQHYSAENSQNFPKLHRLTCVQGEHWQWQGLQFEVLSPLKTVERAKNIDSCVVLIKDEWQHQILLTGDIDRQVEINIVQQLPKLDVLQVAHHGSKTSSSELLLAKTQPTLGIISASRFNQWNFPHFSVVERLNRYQVKILNTATSGQISVNFFPQQIQVQTARSENSPWFRRTIGLSTK